MNTNTVNVDGPEARILVAQAWPSATISRPWTILGHVTLGSGRSARRRSARS